MSNHFPCKDHQILYDSISCENRHCWLQETVISIWWRQCVSHYKLDSHMKALQENDYWDNISHFTQEKRKWTNTWDAKVIQSFFRSKSISIRMMCCVILGYYLNVTESCIFVYIKHVQANKIKLFSLSRFSCDQMEL